MVWDPAQYLKFGGLRMRPALDLMGALDVDDPACIVDLGCGTGHITALLAERWPSARVSGIDNSAAMLETAAGDHPDLDWILHDIADWSPQGPFDLLFSNAALHWLDDHDRVFPRLAGFLAPGGVLAVQMPHNHGAPSHTLVAEAAAAGPWWPTLSLLLRPAPVAAADHYYALLAGLCSSVTIWETEYLHVLEGPNPVAEWTKGSLLRPLLAALDEPLRVGFENEYRRRVATAYPPLPDGTTLLPFKRFFLVARA